MDVTEAVETRLEVREYSDEPVDDEVKSAVLEAGRLASSGKNLEHWRFVLVADEENLRQVADRSPSGSWVADADFAVVICTDPTYEYHAIDAGRSLTYMQLVAWEVGVGSCIYTVDQPELNEFLAVPEEYHLTAVVGFGHPAREFEGVKSRKPLSEIAYVERFGEPLDLS